MLVKRRKCECAGIVAVSFGTGLIAARLIPYSVMIIIVAAVLIAIGTLNCRFY